MHGTWNKSENQDAEYKLNILHSEHYRTTFFLLWLALVLSVLFN